MPEDSGSVEDTPSVEIDEGPVVEVPVIEGVARGASAVDKAAVFQFVDQFAIPNPSLTLVQVIERTGADPDRLWSLWGALGLAHPNPDEPAFNDADAEIIGRIAEVARSAPLSTDMVIQLARVIGSSTATLASAQLDAMVALMGSDAASDALGEPDVWFDEFAKIIVQVWRRQLQAAARARLAHGDGGPLVAEQVVGFADLVGFTALSQQLDPVALSAVIARFESVAFAIIGAHGGRVVKMIGDEVMFSIEDPVEAVQCALELAESYHQADDLSDVRVGMAYGSVIEREGDLFGPTVNLASRITGIAYPASVLIGRRLHDAVVDHADFAMRAMGQRRLKDIGKVSLYVVRAADAEDTVVSHRAERRAQRRQRVIELLEDRPL